MLHGGAFLLLEGVGDIRFWTKRRRTECELIDGEGKSNVVGAMQRLDSDGAVGVLGVVDDDYDSILGTKRVSRNLVHTDAHDLECILCKSTALDAVLGEFGHERKMRAFEAKTGMDVRTNLLHRALVFGRLRLVTVYYELDIDNKAIRVARFVDNDTWSVDSDLLFRSVVRRGSSDTESIVRRSVMKLPKYDPWRIARGHDVVQLLRIGLMRVLGNIRSSVGEDHIVSLLRTALSPRDFQSTTLWQDIRVWEAGNKKFPILRNGA